MAARYAARMLPRSRFRRLIKWTGTLMCGVIVLAAAACLRWSYVSMDSACGWVGIGAGALRAASPSNRYLLEPAGLHAGNFYESWADLRTAWRSSAAWPPS